MSHQAFVEASQRSLREAAVIDRAKLINQQISGIGIPFDGRELGVHLHTFGADLSGSFRHSLVAKPCTGLSVHL